MENNKEIRWKQRFMNFEKSYNTLKENINIPIKSKLEQAGIIQLFEITFELSWKLMKDYLESEGFQIKSPKETIKKAYEIELINDGHKWMDALIDRNLTVHTYDEKLAEKIIKDIKEEYFPEFKNLYEKMKKEL